MATNVGMGQGRRSAGPDQGFNSRGREGQLSRPGTCPRDAILRTSGGYPSREHGGHEIRVETRKGASSIRARRGAVDALPFCSGEVVPDSGRRGLEVPEGSDGETKPAGGSKPIDPADSGQKPL